MTRPDWWNEFLVWVDGWPSATTPFDLAKLLQDPPDRPWAASGEFPVLSWALMRPLHSDRPKEPLGQVDQVLGSWRDHYDELAERGPPELQARICEILWAGRRRGALGPHVYAERAVDAYLSAIPDSKDRTGIPGAGHYARRALSIARQLSHRTLDARATEAAEGLLRDAQAATMQRWVIARALADTGGAVSKEVAVTLETFVDGERVDGPRDWSWARAVLGVAADARAACDEDDEAARLRQRAARMHVQQAESLHAAGASPMLVANCLSCGVRSLRSGGWKEEGDEAHRRLLEIQRLIPAAMKQVSSHSIDLTREALAAVNAVRGKPFVEQLLAMTALVQRPRVPQLREFAERSMEQFISQRLFAYQAVDAHGRNARSASDPVERNMIEQAARHRHCTVIGAINPVRQQIALEAGNSLDIWIDALRDRPLVDQTRIVSLAKGLSAGLTGDWIVSTSVLVPQLEFLLRHLLGEADELTSTVNADGTQRERLVSELLKKRKLVEILDEDWVYDLTTLLVEPGSNLRNRVAHGMVSDTQFNSVESLYLWFTVIDLVFGVGIADGTTTGVSATAARAQIDQNDDSC